MAVREITNHKDIDFLLNLQEKDINKDLIIELFGTFKNTPKFNTGDILTIPPDKYGPTNNRNRNQFRTTVGLWIFNKYFIEKDLFDVFKYINHEIDGKTLKEMNERMSYLILEDKLDINKQLNPYLMKQQHIMRFVSILSSNHTMKMLKSSSHINKKKKELIKKNKDELEKGNEVVAAEIEKELLHTARDYLRDDPSMEMYDSKSRGSFDNNFKNMFIMKGAIMNPQPGKGFDITTSNYMDGINKDEYAIFANSLVAGAYAKAKNTEVGGTWVKLYILAFQHLILDNPGSDCGTDKYIEVALNRDNINKYMYNYVIESNNRLVEITSENKNRYINKYVKMRFVTVCKSKTGFCNKCAGNLYYRLGIKNIGMTTPKIPTKIMLLSMKKFHSSQIGIVEMDPVKAFGLK